MAGFIQDNRFLFVETPLGKNKLLLQSLSGQEAISQLFSFQLEMLSEDINIDHSKIIGQNATVGFFMSDNSTPRYLNGYISHFAQLPGEGRFIRYRAELVPWLWFLTRTTDCRIFQNMTVPDIIQKVFGDFGFHDYEVRLHATYTEWEYCVQYRETACNFVMRLMEQEGIFFFFKHENGKHTMVLADSKSDHKPCDFQSSFKYERVTGSGWLRDQDTVYAWNPGHYYRPGKYALNEFYFETPTTDLMTNIDTKLQHGGNTKYEVYDYPGEYEKRGDGDTWVRLRMEEQEAAYAVDTGESNCRPFSAGFKFNLTNHNRQDQNGSYVLTSVTHSATEGGTYPGAGGGGEGEGLYSNFFTCIPYDVPFRPARATSKPLIEGLQTAIVVGPSGEEIYVDKYGRIKVQFHWDREGKYNEKSSCWIRFATPWAGKQWGAIHIPRIGQEVIVAFLEGDPDRPLILGAVYNAGNMPPYTLPDEKTKSTVKSYSSKGGGGFNEIRFEDKKGDEQIFIYGEKNQDVRIKKDRMEWIGNDTHLIVKHDQLEQVEGDKHLSVTGDHNTKVDGGVSLKVSQDIQKKSGMKYAVDAGTEIHLKAGMSITVEAGAALTLKVGGSFININPAGIAISGPMIMINSGGAAGSGSGSSPNAPKAPKEADKAESGVAPVLPPPKKPAKPSSYSPMAMMLSRAAQDGMPFCDT
jgi:type VI secretion system secreted protein VgrG